MKENDVAYLFRRFNPLNAGESRVDRRQFRGLCILYDNDILLRVIDMLTAMEVRSARPANEIIIDNWPLLRFIKVFK